MSDTYSRWNFPFMFVVPAPDNALRTAVTEYLHTLHARQYSPRTIDRRRHHLGELVTWLHRLGVEEPRQVTRRMLEEYRTWLHAYARRSFDTQSSMLSEIRAFFRSLVQLGVIDADPAMYLELPRRRKRVPTATLTHDEVETILTQPDLSTVTGIRDRAIMETLFATGIRRNELVRLTIDDIDSERQRITVHHGKGGRARVVPISARALEWIDRYLQVRPPAVKAAETRVLFLNKFRELMGADALTRNVGNYIHMAGVNKPGGCHMFRATTATMMLEAGADIRFVQQMLGHVDIQTTQLYARVTVGTLQSVYAKTHPSALSKQPIPDAS